MKDVVLALEKGINESVLLSQGKLDALKNADAAQPPPKKHPTTEAANLRMSDGFERTITHLFKVEDEETMYLELRATLMFKDERASALGYGEIVDALDRAEENAHRGAELSARAQLDYVNFELDAKLILSSLRDNAKQELESRKAELKAETKTSGKQITNDDIEAEIASQHPDEWAELETRRAKAKLAVKLFADLAERLVQRAGHLRTMVARSRSVE